MAKKSTVAWSHINQELPKRKFTTAQWYKAHPVAHFRAKVQAIRNNANTWPEEKTIKLCRIACTIGTRIGEIIRPEICDKCGKPCKPDCHHDDYRKPLAIKWFCRPCHLAYDKAERLRKGIKTKPMTHHKIDYSVYLRAVDMVNGGMLQSETARILGISYSTCSKWMAGLSRPLNLVK